MNYTLPWYDSQWLSSYLEARHIVQGHHPERLAEFTGAIDVFRTRPDFEVVHFKNLLPPAQLDEIKHYVRGVAPKDIEMGEMLDFGRVVQRRLPYFNQLQAEMTPFVAEHAGEAVDPCYNFLSKYNNLGVCATHLDAPEAKWTLDICIEQSAVWPIHFSQVVPWPEDYGYEGDDWEARIKNDKNYHFTAYALEPGDAILFSGSSQWHYRERITRTTRSNFCNLVFMHFVPKGTLPLSVPTNWADLFGMAALSDFSARQRKYYD